MKTMKQLLIANVLLQIVFCNTGCMSAKSIARELGKDNATVTLDVTTIYGNIRAVRTNPTTNHSVTIQPNGNISIERVK